MTKGVIKLLFFAFSLLVFVSCKKEKPPSASDWQGSGVEFFSDYEPQAGKQMRLFYYVPVAVLPTTPIVFLFHGAERDAMAYRNSLINKANVYGFIVVVPEFSEINFPGVSAYQIGNVYDDGDEPSPATLHPEEQWSFSFIEPIFSFVKNKTKNTSARYHVIGHSAGAQFAHRFLMFKPSAKVGKTVVSAAGWYTALDTQITFPYGLQDSPIENLDLGPLFEKQVYVQVGTADNNPNASSLRRNTKADLQGLHRLARAQYFYNKAEVLAVGLSLPFVWKLVIIPGLSHDHVAAVGHSADLLFK